MKRRGEERREEERRGEERREVNGGKKPPVKAEARII